MRKHGMKERDPTATKGTIPIMSASMESEPAQGGQRQRRDIKPWMAAEDVVTSTWTGRAGFGWK